MTRFVLYGNRERKRACEAIMQAPDLWRVDVREPRRTDDQNEKMQAMVGDIHKQHGSWFGPSLTRDDIRHIFVGALYRELRLVRNPDGSGFVPLAHSSAHLTVKQTSDLIEMLYAWGADAEHPVTWTEPAQQEGVGA